MLHPSTLEFYSSKPPLLVDAGGRLYWLLKLDRLDADEAGNARERGGPHAAAPHQRRAVRDLPVAAVAGLVETWGTTRLGPRCTSSRPARSRTLVRPFLITLNNHTIGTFAVMFAWLSLLVHRCGSGDEPAEAAWYHLVSAGFFAAFAAANELPALAFTAAVLRAAAVAGPRRRCCWRCPGRCVVARGVLCDELRGLGTCSVRRTRDRSCGTNTRAATGACRRRTRSKSTASTGPAATARGAGEVRCTCWSGITACSR